MNFKPSYLVRALCAVAAFGALSGTASAASCPEIDQYVLANRGKVEAALLAYYGDSEKRVKLGKNNGNYSFMTIKGVSVEGAKNCVAFLRLSADKNKFTGNPAHQQLEKRDGTVKLDINFGATSGNRLCINANRTTSANWRSEGGVKEKIFVKAHRNTFFFKNGCLF